MTKLHYECDGAYRWRGDLFEQRAMCGRWVLVHQGPKRRTTRKIDKVTCVSCRRAYRSRYWLVFFGTVTGLVEAHSKAAAFDEFAHDLRTTAAIRVGRREVKIRRLRPDDAGWLGEHARERGYDKYRKALAAVAS